jgi:hypothetical protein
MAPVSGAADAPVPGRVRGPYVVETYAVSVEPPYLVVDVPDAGR